MTKLLSKPESDLLVVTAGEPAGIGPELCLALAESKWAEHIVIIADPDLLNERAALLNKKIAFGEYGAALTSGKPMLLPQPLAKPAICGKPDPANAQSILDGLKRASDGCVSGEFRALITGPIQKNVINEAGISFTGHTEYLAELTGTELPVMLLAVGDLRVALVTTHLPISEVPSAITTQRIIATLKIIHSDLVSKFQIEKPKIIVCGLNPHAGEGGYLGREDQEIIKPAIDHCNAIGLEVRGPLPADTAFSPATGSSDAILAMYHDQGLPVIKYAGFGQVVNITLGLPIIRTSVDHGTALDIAGKGRADPGSFFAAIELAAKLTQS